MHVWCCTTSALASWSHHWWHDMSYGVKVEAMSMGIPVIATNWSGNSHFMTDDNSFPVHFSLVEIAEREEQRGHRWAQADISHLRQQMRAVVQEREEARRRAMVAQQQVRERYR